MLDHRVGVVAEAVGVDHLLEDLGVELLGGLAGMELQLRVQAESHRVRLSPGDVVTPLGVILPHRPARDMTVGSRRALAA